jgi:hypothetical protein
MMCNLWEDIDKTAMEIRIIALHNDTLHSLCFDKFAIIALPDAAFEAVVAWGLLKTTSTFGSFDSYSKSKGRGGERKPIKQRIEGTFIADDEHKKDL